MAGTTLSTPGVPIRESVFGGVGSSNPSYFNSFRISAIAGRLATHVSPQLLQEANDVVEFCQLCIALARGIDWSIARHDVPHKASELPSLFKQVCRRKTDPFMQAAIMVLMISVKSACQSGWFSDKDSEDLCNLANEVSSSFCSSTNFRREPSNSSSPISMVMSRFYPLLKLGEIFAFLEIKPGYGTFINDIHISKNVKISSDDKIRLLVAQIDNSDTSSCLVSPPLANFLLNGKGVEKRTNASTDTGPQIPTPVSHMLKYGTNLLQAVGEFNGNYIVALAFMSMNPTPDPATLPDYVQPAPASLDPDSEIIEGPSRISLNCPISFRRIKVPVKSQSCKHLQCFDYHNFVDINSRRPSWRCPHCNQNATFTDLRIDQEMAKVLKEVGESITDVILSSDGSWKAIMEGDAHNNNHTENSPKCSKDEPIHLDSGSIPSFSADIMDLTEMDDDRKTTQKPDSDFWSGLYLSTFDSGPSTTVTPPPVLTDALIPATGDSSTVSSNEYGRMPSITRFAVNRSPIAVQALPAQQRPRISTATAVIAAASLASQFPSRQFSSPYTTSFSRNNLQPMLTAQKTAQVARPVQLSRPAAPSPPVSTPEEWRPLGRMRGSLSGRAFSEALEHYIPVQLSTTTTATATAQQVQSARPSLPPNISPQLQALLANRFGGLSSLTTTNQPSSSPDVPPQQSPRMQ